ncbi:MAG: hypothetical protein QM496_18155 [Verrucomicrobiota bacterium]
METKISKLNLIFPILVLGVFLATPGYSKDEQQSVTENDDAQPEPNYYTEKEYQVLKAGREKSGIYFLDRPYTERELDKILNKEMGVNEVVAFFGKPSMKMKPDEGGSFSYSYHLAWERLPIESGTHLNGFTVQFNNGKVDWWGMVHTNMTRASKPLIVGEPSSLKMISSRDDFSDADIDLVAYLEDIVIPDLGHKLNRNDYANLVYMVVQTYYTEVNATDAGDSSIKADCDIIKILAQNLPEVSKFKKASKKNTLNLKELKDILEPYWSGEKLYPGETKSSHAALMKKSAKSLPKPATSSGNWGAKLDLKKAKVEWRFVVVKNSGGAINVKNRAHEGLSVSPDIAVELSDIDSASVSFGGNGWQIAIKFTEEGARRFSALTQSSIGKQLAILVNDEAVLTPNIDFPILNGKAVIPVTDMKQNEAQRLVEMLKFQAKRERGARPLIR